MRDMAAPPITDASVAREPLEPMLDELVRGLGYERALLLVHEPETGALRGLFGLNIRDDLARRLSVPLARADDPLVVALRAGAPQLVDDVSVDERLHLAERHALLAMNVTRFVATSLPAVGSERATAVVILARDREIRIEDLDPLVPFSRQAGAALPNEHDAELLRRASESHAVEKEWLLWVVNAVDDPVLVAAAANDILHFNRRAEDLPRASSEDSAGKRRAGSLYKVPVSPSASTVRLQLDSTAADREVT